MASRNPLKLNVLDRADFVRSMINIRDEIDKVLAVVMPDDEPAECTHPTDQIAEPDTMDDDAMYRCNACGKTQAHPFISED